MTIKGRRSTMRCALGLFIFYGLDSVLKAITVIHEGLRVATTGLSWWIVDGALAIRFGFMAFLLFTYLRLKQTSAGAE